MLRKFQVESDRVLISDELDKVSSAMLEAMGEDADPTKVGFVNAMVSDAMSPTGVVLIWMSDELGGAMLQSVGNADYAAALLKQQGGIELQ